MFEYNTGQRNGSIASSNKIKLELHIILKYLRE